MTERLNKIKQEQEEEQFKQLKLLSPVTMRHEVGKSGNGTAAFLHNNSMNNR